MPSEQGLWPNGARAAIALTLDNMGEAADLDRGLWPASQAIGSHYSVTTVLPQLLQLLARYDIKVTYFIESWNLSSYPEAVRSIANAGHEVGWHAWRHEAWSKLKDEDAERANFERSFGSDGLAGFNENANGIDAYRGFRPPGGIIHGERTMRLCRSHGLRYISPAAEHAALLPLDDEKDAITILPFRWATVDAYYYMEAFGGLRKAKGEFPEDSQSPSTLVRKYKELIDNAVETGTFLSLLFHPFLTDRPERLEAMETVVQYLAQKRDEGAIWLARCCEIDSWVRDHPDSVGEDPLWDATSWR